MTKPERGRVIVISGPSGVGKTTLYKRVLEELEEKLSFSISATTRDSRPGELDGIDYYFISQEDFKEHIDNNDFLEWEEVYGNFYGTLKSEVTRVIESGKSILLDVDVKGGISIRKEFPEAYLVFILPPSVNELRKRLVERNTDSPEALKIRTEKAINELEFVDQYPCQIINKDKEIAFQELKYVVQHIIDD